MSNFLVIKIFVQKIVVLKNGLTKILNKRKIGSIIYYTWPLGHIINYLCY